MKNFTTIICCIAVLNVFGQNTFPSSGSVGIGTTTPSNRLQVYGTTFNRVSAIVGADVQTGFQAKKIGANATDWEFYIPSSSTDLRFYNAEDRMTLKANGNVGIGTTTPQNKLDVNGTIHSKEVKVDLTGWPDYVFAKDYEPTSLEDLKSYIEENQHLPEMPSAKQVESEGIQLGEMNKLLLKKIEEMTLYMIKASERIEELEIKIQSIESKTN